MRLFLAESWKCRKPIQTGCLFVRGRQAGREAGRLVSGRVDKRSRWGTEEEETPPQSLYWELFICTTLNVFAHKKKNKRKVHKTNSPCLTHTCITTTLQTDWQKKTRRWRYIYQRANIYILNNRLQIRFWQSNTNVQINPWSVQTKQWRIWNDPLQTKMTVEIIVKDLRRTVDNMFWHIILDTQHTEQH